jgi:hypothetical protein
VRHYHSSGQGRIAMRAVKVLQLALATTLATAFAGQAASENVLRTAWL